MDNSWEKKQTGRPHMPSGYGLAPISGEKDLLDWARVEERLKSSHNYWVGSTRPDGRPHVMPVWGIWMDDVFFFSTDPHSRKGRNLAANPEMVMHLESGDDAIIVEGRVVITTDPAELNKVDQAYHSKYQIHLTGDEAPAGQIYALRPRVVLAWQESSFTTSATRWKIKQ